LSTLYHSDVNGNIIGNMHELNPAGYTWIASVSYILSN